MKALSFLFIPVLGLLVCGQSLCPLDKAVSEKIQDVTTSLFPEAVRNIGLNCHLQVPGHLPFSCTCGCACGSWDVRAETTCHCQCADMNWTGARRCLLRLQ